MLSEELIKARWKRGWWFVKKGGKGKRRGGMERRPMEKRTEHRQVPLAVPYLHKIIYSARTWREITPWLRQARVLALTNVQRLVFIIENRFSNSRALSKI